ncbi:3-methyl-2-oxobutanoate hydroxymethyltransferase [compost metagenome]
MCLTLTVDELIPLVRAVTKATQRALVIADLSFSAYQASPKQCSHTAVRFMKEAGAHAVKLEGGPQVRMLASSGIPVMGHIPAYRRSRRVRSANCCRIGRCRLSLRKVEGRRLWLNECSTCCPTPPRN